MLDDMETKLAGGETEMRKWWLLVYFVFLTFTGQAVAGPREALLFYHKVMNPQNCPTWALYEVGEPYHPRLELEHDAFNHFISTNAGIGDERKMKYEEMFYEFRLDINREKSPSFFLVWLRAKFPYEKR
jgi:hypothetical protein